MDLIEYYTIKLVSKNPLYVQFLNDDIKKALFKYYPEIMNEQERKMVNFDSYDFRNILYVKKKKMDYNKVFANSIKCYNTEEYLQKTLKVNFNIFTTSKSISNSSDFFQCIFFSIYQMEVLFSKSKISNNFKLIYIKNMLTNCDDRKKMSNFYELIKKNNITIEQSLIDDIFMKILVNEFSYKKNAPDFVIEKINHLKTFGSKNSEEDINKKMCNILNEMITDFLSEDSVNIITKKYLSNTMQRNMSMLTNLNYSSQNENFEKSINLLYMIKSSLEKKSLEHLFDNEISMPVILKTNKAKRI